MAGYELASAYVNLLVETNDVSRQIGGMFKGVEKTAATSGKGAGAAFSKAVEGSAKPKIDVKAEADKAAAQVQVASKKVEAARAGEEAAARKVQIAEAKLSELRASGKAKTSQLLTAEDNLAKAKQSSALASEKTKAAVKGESDAKTRAVAASDQLAASQRKVETATESTGREFTTLKSRMQAALKGNFKGAFSRIPKDADASADKVERRFNKAGKDSSNAFGSAFKGALAGIAAYVSVDAVVGGFKSIMEESGNLEQSVGAIQSVFKENSKTMLDWSSQAATAVGLSKNEFNELGTLIGSQLKNAGEPIDKVAGGTKQLIELGADLASMFGGTTREAVESISSALKGERDPIEKYGVSLKQASIDAQALEMGFKKTGKTFDQNAQSAATIALIMAQTSDAQGNFARETDTLAHKQQVAGAQWDNLKAKMGDLFLPMLTRVMGAVTDKALPAFESLIEKFKAFGGWVKNNSAWLGPLAGVVIGVATAIGIYSAAMGIATLATSAWGVALAVTPLGWIALAIAGVVGALTWFFTKTQLGQAIWTNTWNAIKTAALAVFTWFQTYVVPVWNAVMNAIGIALSWVWNTILKPIFTALVAFWQTVIAPVLTWLGGLFGAIFKGIGLVVSLWWLGVKTIFTALVAFWQTYVVPVLQWLKGVFAAVFSLIGAAIKFWWSNVVKPAFAALIAFWKNNVVPVLNWLKGVFSSVFSLIGSLIKTWWAGVKIVFGAVVSYLKATLGPIFKWLYNNVIKPVWNGIKNTISGIWKNGIKPVFNTLGNFIKDKVAPLFKKGVDAIGKAWDGLKNIAKLPVKFVVNTVINKGIVGTFNDIADNFPGTKKMPKLKLPKGFRTGGKVWGPGTETSDSIPARLSKNEHVLTAKDVRNMGGHANVYRLRSMAARGEVPGFAKGGTLWDAAQWWRGKGARASRHSWFNGGKRITSGHSNGSYHYKDQAVDLNYGPGGTNATEQAFFDKWIGQFQAQFPGIRTIWRAPGHYNHLHIDTANGANMGAGSVSSGDGGGADILGGFLNPFKALKEKLGKQFAKFGKFGEIAKGMGEKAINAPIEWIKSNISKVTDFVSEGADFVKGGITKGAAWGKGQSWAISRGLSPKEIGYMNWIVSKESGWNPKAQNPRSSASGLPQFINSTSRAYLGGSPAKKYGVFDQLDGMQRYVNDRYGGWGGAIRFWKSHHYYKDGGAVIPEYDDGGLLKKGTQLIQHNKSAPDRVLTEKQWDGIYEAAKVGMANGMTIQLTTPTVERNEVDEWVDKTKFAFTHLAKTSAFSGVNG